MIAENKIDHDQLILDHQNLVDQAVYSYYGRCNHTLLAEIRSDANLGLVLAARDYDPAKNESFAAYARQRIYFSVKDGFRQRDHLKRSYRRKLQEDAPRLVALNDLLIEEAVAREDNQLELVEQRDMVRYLLKGIPLYLRRVVYLRFWRNLEFDEIARRLNMSESSAARHLRVALGAMKAKAVNNL